MALARGFTADLQAVGRRTEVNILRLYINGAGIDVSPHRGQIIHIGG
ncbi:Uncharacterised protein [Yersinia rohdei]|nr:Uncharacterised protein [Yersinia rohdei]CNJ56201.1 Uncharacterised protein [Yersinia rohdei]CQJ62437.1 Uncharacterised protein [Yersinia rohdei]